MIWPPSTVANRRSLETRIAVTRGTASLSSGGIGPLRAAETPGEGVRVAPASGLSVETNGTFRAGGFDPGFFAGTPTAGDGGARREAGGAFPGFAVVGLDSGFFAGKFTAGGGGARREAGGAFPGFAVVGFDSGFFTGTLTAGAVTLAATGRRGGVDGLVIRYRT